MLILLQNGVEIDRVAEGDWMTLPNGDRVAPTMAGWKDGAFELIQGPDGIVQPVETPEMARENMVLSFAQLMIGLVAEGWITEAEGLAWLKRELPAAVTALIATLPAGQRFAATARATDPQFVKRTDPLVVSLGAAQGKTEGQIDAFFMPYANV